MAVTVKGKLEAMALVAKAASNFVRESSPREAAGIEPEVRLTPAEEGRLSWAVDEVAKRLDKIAARAE